MAVLDPPSVEDVQSRFGILLQRAKEIKPSSAIEPPLPASAFSGALGLPHNEISTKSHATAVEIAARRVFQKQAVNINQFCRRLPSDVL
jgi:hypothetical protein